MILAAQIVLGISLAGIIIMLFRKIPVLAELSPEKEQSLPGSVAEHGVKDGDADSAVTSPFDNFLQKLLLRTKVLNLKTENKISSWLERLRQKNKKKETTENQSDDYWEQLKKTKEGE